MPLSISNRLVRFLPSTSKPFGMSNVHLPEVKQKAQINRIQYNEMCLPTPPAVGNSAIQACTFHKLT